MAARFPAPGLFQRIIFQENTGWQGPVIIQGAKAKKRIKGRLGAGIQGTVRGDHKASAGCGLAKALGSTPQRLIPDPGEFP
jgi:hypothetical protein